MAGTPIGVLQNLCYFFFGTRIFKVKRWDQRLQKVKRVQWNMRWCRAGLSLQLQTPSFPGLTAWSCRVSCFPRKRDFLRGDEENRPCQKQPGTLRRMRGPFGPSWTRQPRRHERGQEFAWVSAATTTSAEQGLKWPHSPTARLLPTKLQFWYGQRRFFRGKQRKCIISDCELLRISLFQKWEEGNYFL